MQNLKAGLLPMYLELYDRVLPGMRIGIEEFYQTIAEEFAKRGVEVVSVPVCRLASEFQSAISRFGSERVDAIITLHLAYSPSLESADALASCRLPVIVLDTTPDSRFDHHQDPERILYNHGIHGVQDLCNVLLRKGKKFQIEVGHWEKTDVLERVVEWLRAARLATAMRSARVGLVGSPFACMGDFAVPFDSLKSSIGIETIKLDSSHFRSILNEVDEDSIEAEMISDSDRFHTDGLDDNLHRCAAKTSIALRRWMERERLCALTMNFLSIDEHAELPTVPFLEASKAMARGTGYAGEGDVLTAALVGSLLSVFPETTFTEMFCPDWDGDSIFLSHMGEVNLRLLAAKAKLKPCAFPFTNVTTPVIGVGRYKPGEALLVNLAPAPGESFRLFAAPVTMLDVTDDDRLNESIHGWLRPSLPIVDFLARYSQDGGTHHIALVYGARSREIARWGKIMGWETIVLGQVEE
jgi:L-arabinose isomerase